MSMIEDIDTLHNVGSNDFWLNAKNDLIINKIKKKNAKILDVGCGAGSLTLELAKKGHIIDAIDISDNAIVYTKRKTKDMNCVNVWKSAIEDLIYEYDYIVMFDILEHVDNDSSPLVNARRILKKNGYLIINIPAIKRLYGRHDIHCEHKRRYDKKEIKNKLDSNGFEIVFIRYWNFIMLPMTFIFKMLDKDYPHNKINSFLNRLLKIYYMKVENRIRLPLGISLFIIAKKKD